MKINYMNNINLLKEYLTHKSLYSWEKNGELITHCLLNECDRDSKENEAHLYVDLQTTQYDCKKCGDRGNIISLAEKLRDKGDSYIWDHLQKQNKPVKARFDTEVKNNHEKLPAEIRLYLNEVRGWSNEIINQKKIGWVQQWGTNWIGFPIKDESGKYKYYKLRENYLKGNRKITSSEGSSAQIYDWETLNLAQDSIILCEGEGDCLLLLSKGLYAVTNTHGAGTFKDEWLQFFPKDKTYYIAYDNDKAGIEGSEKVASRLHNFGVKKVYVINLPKRIDTSEHPEASKEKVDITNYFMELGGTTEDLFNKYAKEYPEKIDSTKFKPLSSEDISKILDLTIKKDDINKVTTFLCQLSAFTEDNQFNISFQAPSSSGKSHIPIEISKLFPSEDVLKLGNCSPTAFFHEQGKYDKEKNEMRIDLSRKILIFLDMPHTQLLERLRPLLSHDEKEMQSKITDKSQKGGNKTKTVIIIGYPSVIFCTAGLTLDEQEATRFLLLSPETNQEKIRGGVQQVIRKEVNNTKYQKTLDENEERQLLVERIKAIKQEKIIDIQIGFDEQIEQRYLTEKKLLKPRHQRDVKRLISLVKSFALLNLWWRKREGNSVIANNEDIDEAFKIWDQISESQELNLPPYVYNFYHEIIVTLWESKNTSTNPKLREAIGPVGLSRNDITKWHTDVYGRRLPIKSLAEDILPLLEEAGLIFQIKDSNDQRTWLVYVADDSTKEIKEEVDGREEQNQEANNAFNIFGQM